MHVEFTPPTHVVERPAYVWAAVVLEILTGIMAIPVGLMFLGDPSGRAVQVPQGWIEQTPFGSYLIPGLYLLLMNGVGMLVLAGLTIRRHWFAPWLTGILGGGLIIWILVEIVALPETMVLTWLFLAIGVALSVIALGWLRRTGQLRLW
jgi:hypothetical protein